MKTMSNFEEHWAADLLSVFVAVFWWGLVLALLIMQREVAP